MALLGALVHGAGCAHVVRLNRPERVGDRVALRGEGTLRGTVEVRVDGAVVEQKEETLEVSLEGVATVQEVDGRAMATRTAFLVERSSGGQGSERHEILPAGTTVVAESVGGKSSFTVGGAPVAPDASQALGLVLSTHEPGRPNDDDVFGTREPRRVGESWPIDARTAAEDLAKSVGGSAGDLRVNGATTLLGTRTESGEACLEIEGRMSVGGVRIPLPPGFSVEEADTQVIFHGLVPADPDARHRRGGRIAMTLSVRAAGRTPDGKAVQMSIRQERRSSVQLIPTPPVTDEPRSRRAGAAGGG